MNYQADQHKKDKRISWLAIHKNLCLLYQGTGDNHEDHIKKETDNLVDHIYEKYPPQPIDITEPSRQIVGEKVDGRTKKMPF